ncbi:minichromosome maintenance (MCM2/3/5) family protein [Artemisia annua]|uniref:Minichromosome maintenance (MCM2/3/5) family protein n=1 Tax=Artemisia annua TaxID=35608 RepID=A0A2U1LA31_ARTAN|nr:minichromosome maintenance (MCM2/3/5) family protein [Artemisia annua]
MIFANKQNARVQETPDEIHERGTPHTLSLLMHDKLADAITGIYRAMSVRVGQTERTLKSYQRRSNGN